jgi:hypothetical protein
MKVTVAGDAPRIIESFQIPLDVQEVTVTGAIECGFQVEWVTATAEDGAEIDASAGAGVGSAWMTVRVTRGDQTRYARVDIRPVVQQIADRFLTEEGADA